MRVQDRNKITKSIDNAFSEVDCPFQGAIFSHDELIQARFEFSLMNANAFQYVLPKILTDFLLYYPEDLQGLDYVLDYLNVPSVIPQEEISRISNVLGRDIALIVTSDEDKIIQHKKQSFSLFTHEQMSVLLEWLRTVSTWSEANASQGDIESAIEYWDHERLANRKSY